MYLILAFILGISFNAIASVLLKIGVGRVVITGLSWQSAVSILSNLYLWGGIILYGVSFPPYLYTFKKLSLSVAYPTFVSLSFAAVAILSFFFLKESLTILQLLGLILVVGGIVLLATNSA
tara:strand:- start:187 stop:549 length:363 start_codon:yes stop_codon:yes gene_type:complete